MKFKDLVNMEAFEAHLKTEKKSLFDRWARTAIEISHYKYKEIANLQLIYNEIPPEELRTSQFISFIQELLNILSNEEDQKTLIRIEALQFRRTDF